MSFPRYPKYKPSGVEWLGEVPDGWDLKPLRYICYCLDGSRVPLNSAQRAEKQGNVPYWGANSIMDYVDEALFDEDLVLLGEDGAPFFDKLKPIAFFSRGKVWPNNHVHVLRPVVTETAKFITHALNITDFANFIDGSTRDKLTQGSMKEIPLPFPPLPEQTAIAEFLDRETGKIDELVAEQRRLMELLKEKRQAVISHAVTKGLNPHAPMKPSGIEWLGDVPVGWTSGRLRYFTELIVDGTHHSPQSLPSGDYLYITAKNIKEHGFDFSEITYLTELQHREIFTRCPVRKGDVLYIKDGATAGIAMVNPIVEEFSLLSSVALIRTHQTKLIPEFIAYQLNASQFKNPALNRLVGGAMTRFTLELISRFEVSLPPLEEQRSIVAQLELETAKFDTLTAEAQRAIDLLQERRTALISAAVTGQIDVRS